MKLSTLLFSLAILPLSAFTPNLEPEAAFKKLKDGNNRFASDDVVCPDSREMLRLSVVEKQNPIATIVGCSDSRVPPDLVFDQGVGDLFVVRIAGNVIGNSAIESIDYAVNHLHTGLIVVLGHANCGAVSAVLSGSTEDMRIIASKIEPAIAGIKPTEPDALEKAIKANVMAGVKQIQAEPRLSSLIQSGQIKVVGGYYRLDSGRVEWLP